MFLLDEWQISEVVANLVFNSIDASHPGQTIEIGTRNCGDDHAEFYVRDWGKGITPDQKQHLFQRFYTSKPAGSGVGLWMVQKLVEENHDGKVSVESPEGGGAVVTVRLPKMPGSRREADHAH